MTYAEISGSGGKESEALYPVRSLPSPLLELTRRSQAPADLGRLAKLQEYSAASSLPFPTLPAPSIQERPAVATQIRFGWALSQSSEWLQQGKRGDGGFLDSVYALSEHAVHALRRGKAPDEARESEGREVAELEADLLSLLPLR